MSELAKVDDNFPSCSIYLNVCTDMYLLDFGLSIFLHLENDIKISSSLIKKNFFCLINIYFITMDCNLTLSVFCLSMEHCPWLRRWLRCHLAVTFSSLSKCVCGSRSTLFWCVVFLYGAQGYNTLKGFSVWWMKFMCYYSGSLVCTVSGWWGN